MRVIRLRRPRSRHVLAVVVAFLLFTPWGADAMDRVRTTAVNNVRSVLDPGSVAPEQSAAEVQGKKRPEKREARRKAQQQERRAQRKQGQLVASGAAGSTWHVTSVVDGDTIDVARNGTSERVRVIGIDTPERGVCGYSEAGDTLRVMVLDRDVTLTPGAVDDRDTYGRILRYVDVDGADAGLALLQQGLAIARYDSRDGYGRHPREDAYVAADTAMPDMCERSAPVGVAAPVAPAPAVPAGGGGAGPPGGGAWPGCNEARAAGAAPVYRNDPGYGSHLDGDNDGVGCE